MHFLGMQRASIAASFELDDYARVTAIEKHRRRRCAPTLSNTTVLPVVVIDGRVRTELRLRALLSFELFEYADAERDPSVHMWLSQHLSTRVLTHRFASDQLARTDQDHVRCELELDVRFALPFAHELAADAIEAASLNIDVYDQVGFESVGRCWHVMRFLPSFSVDRSPTRTTNGVKTRRARCVFRCCFCSLLLPVVRRASSANYRPFRWRLLACPNASAARARCK